MLRLNPDDQHLLIRLARETLDHAFDPDPEHVLRDFLREHPETREGVFAEKHPCFVTLLLRNRLRGCIGCLATDDPLIENIHWFTRRAAFQDPRFAQVTPGEVSQIKIEVSVLGPTEPLPSLGELEIGKHGLSVRHLNHHGVLLAKVGEQYGWSREEFLKQTCIKAGLPPENHAAYQVFRFDEISFGEE